MITKLTWTFVSIFQAKVGEGYGTTVVTVIWPPCLSFTISYVLYVCSCMLAPLLALPAGTAACAGEVAIHYVFSAHCEPLYM